MRRIRDALTYANVCATLALFVALSTGGAWAADQLIGQKQLKRNAVTAKALAKSSVTSRAVKNRSLRAIDFARGELPSGPIGPSGPSGPAGSPGEGVTRVARYTYGDSQEVDGTPNFGRVRVIGTFTLPAQATVEVRWASQFSTLSIGGTGLCVAQLRVDGRTDAGTAPSGDDAASGGTVRLLNPGVLSLVGNVAAQAWFTNLPAGKHSLELWVRSSILALVCSEPSAPGIGEAYVTTIG
jgi:hypothetical protein